jgi:hypothetical protein
MEHSVVSSELEMAWVRKVLGLIAVGNAWVRILDPLLSADVTNLKMIVWNQVLFR